MSIARYLVAPSLALSTLAVSNRSRTLQCEATLKPRTSPLIDPHQFATGSVLGIAAGLILRRLGKLFFIVIGASIFLVRALSPDAISFPSLNGTQSVSWSSIRRFLLNKTQSEDALDETNLSQSGIAQFLTKNVTFKVSFLATFLIGLVNT